MGLEGSIVGGKYRVGQKLGAGGMGEVYEAIHEGTERPVAVKVLYPEYAAHPEALVRFDREARAAGRIGHDNICEVTDVGRMESGAPYLVRSSVTQQHSRARDGYGKVDFATTCVGM